MSELALSLIGFPYFNGRRADSKGYQMARGPEVLLEASAIPKALAEVCNNISLTWLDNLDEWIQPAEAVRPQVPGDQMIRQLQQAIGLAGAVKVALNDGRVPHIFSGGCTSSLGVVGGVDNANIGMFWFDAHADDNTPENSTNGLFEGMPVSTIAGECWATYRSRIPGFHTISHQRISQIGLQDRSNWVSRPGRREGVGHLVDPAAVNKWGGQIAQRLTIKAINYASYDVAIDPRAPEVIKSVVVGSFRALQEARKSQK